MKRPSAKIIILVIAVMILLSSQALLPLSVSAAPLPYDNPNAGKNPYKIAIANTVNADMLSAVVGCTGVVNKISKAIMGVLQSATSFLTTSNKSSLGSGSSNNPESPEMQGNEAGFEAKSLQEAMASNKVPTDDQNTQTALKEVHTTLAEDQKREECFNGIAYTLAKNQLTAMTKATMNWINTGLQGNSLYVQDQDGYIKAITDGIIKREAESFGNSTDYPYGPTYVNSLVNAHQVAEKFKDSMKSTLLYYLSNGNEIVDATNMFSSGGWDGWLAMTQYPQNNPMGFTMMNSQYVADEQQNATKNALIDEQNGNGFISQKKCVATQADIQSAADQASQRNTDAALAYQDAYKAYQDAINKWADDKKNNRKDLLSEDESNTLDLKKKADAAAKELAAAEIANDNAQSATKDCTKWKVVTPGSTIRDKVTAYINSPERQLELADTINKSLNALFSYLLARFEDQGLPGLATTSVALTKQPTNFTNSVTNPNGSGGFNGTFDITTDLGNVYADSTYPNPGTGVSDVVNEGKWDASTNTPKLTSSKGKKDHYYTVSVAGDAITVGNASGFNPGDTITDTTTMAPEQIKSISGNQITIGNSDNFNVGDTISDDNTQATQTIKSILSGVSLDGNATWNECDKVFFDGTHWQKGLPDSVLIKEGIIEIQQDYLCIAKAAMKVLPNVMPTLGHLDYCIPGPNPNWKANSQDAQSAYSDWLNGISVKTVDVSNTIESGLGSSFAGIATGGATQNINTGKGKIIFPSSAVYQSMFNGTTLFDIIKKSDFFDLTAFFQDSNDSNGKHSAAYDKYGVITDYTVDTSVATQATPIAQQRVDGAILTWTNYVANMNGEYTKKINDLYGPNSLMQTEFNVDSEYNVTPNSKFLQMAQTGLNITKDMQADNDNINASEKDYDDGIKQANSNIYRLKDMKKQIDAIVNDACQRSDTCKARVAQGLPPLPLPNCTNS